MNRQCQKTDDPNAGLPEKVFPKANEPQVKVVRNMIWGKHIRAYKNFDLGEIILIQQPRFRNCPVEQDVCRRCLKEQKPYSPCQEMQSPKFTELIEKTRDQLVYDMGRKGGDEWNYLVKFSLLYGSDINHARLLRISRIARQATLPANVTRLFQYLINKLPMPLTNDFEEYDYQCIMRLRKTNCDILRTRTPDALYNQITFFLIIVILQQLS
eukprot:UN25409